MSRILSSVVILLVWTCLVGCQSNSDGNNRSSASASSNRSGANDVIENTPAVNNRIQNCRIISYDPRTQATITLVNAAHAWRNDEKGQLNITNGQRNLTYKVLSDLQIDSLLETLEERGSNSIREAWNDRHGALLAHKPRDGESFKGIIVVENNGRRDSYIGRRPGGPSDALGIERYRIFSDLRQAIFVWERTGTTEQVGSGGAGSAAPDTLGVPRDTRR